MSDLEAFRITSVAGLAASVPHLIGYAPADRTVVVMGLDGPRQLGNATFNLGGGIGLYGTAGANAAEAVDKLVPAFERVGADRYIVFAYGVDSDDLANGVGDLITTQASTHQYVERVAVEGTSIRTYDIIGGWSKPTPMPDLQAEWVARGSSVQSSREALITTYTRDEQAPQRAPLDAARNAALLEKSPVERAAHARELIERAAQPGAPDNPADATMLGALMNSSTYVRDHAIHAASQSPAAADVLLRAFRTSPESHRDVLGASAALAHFLTHGSALGARTLAAQVDTKSPHHTLAVITTQLGDSPATAVREAVLPQLHETLERNKTAAVQEWREQRIRAATFPAASTTRGSTHSPTARRTRGSDQRDTGLGK